MARDFDHNIGAEIMGRNKFGPQRGPWQDYEWQGWWGDEPPFHTPVFVLTHHERPSFTLSDTTFHFVGGDPAEVLPRRKAAAAARTSGSAAGRRPSGEFLDADLVDTLHVAVVARWCSGPAHGCGSRRTNCSTASTAMSCRVRAG